MTPIMTLTKNPTTNLKNMMTAVKNFLSSIAAIGNDDFEMYVLEKEMKPAYRANAINPHNSYSTPYSGAFSV